MKPSISALFFLTMLASCESHIPIDTARFTGGCEDDNDCVVVSSNACDTCQIERDAVISLSFGDEYAAAFAAAGEGCYSFPSLSDGSPCPSAPDLIEARCREQVCVEAQ